MQVVFGALAERVITDREQNTVSLIGVIEEISAVPDPSVMANRKEPGAFQLGGSFVVLFRAETDDEKETAQPLKFWIDMPRGRTATTEVALAFGGQPRARAIVHLPQLPCIGSGTYAVVVEFGSAGRIRRFRYEYAVKVLGGAEQEGRRKARKAEAVVP